MEQTSLQRQRVHGPARLIRGWATAFIATTLAGLGHFSAHSITHPEHATEILNISNLTVWLLASVLAAPVCTGFAGRRLASFNTLLSVSTAQLLFHGMYTLAEGAGQAHPVTAPGHEHHLVGINVDGNVAGTVAATNGDHIMLSAHIVAAVLTTAIILHGERTLFQIADQFLLPAPRRILDFSFIPAARPQQVVAQSVLWIPLALQEFLGFITRGPPVSGAVFSKLTQPAR